MLSRFTAGTAESPSLYAATPAFTRRNADFRFMVIGEAPGDDSPCEGGGGTLHGY